MAINIDAANNSTKSLSEEINNLNQAKTYLYTYKCSISNNWKGTESNYLVQGIENTITQIDNVISQLSGLNKDIKIVASKIKNEEEAAAARERAKAKAKRVEKARIEYNKSVKEYNDLIDKINELKSTYKSTKNNVVKLTLKAQIEALIAQKEVLKSIADKNKILLEQAKNS